MTTTTDLARHTAHLYHYVKISRGALAQIGAPDCGIDPAAKADLELETAQVALRKAFLALTGSETDQEPPNEPLEL